VESVRFAVQLTPRGGADQVDGVVDGVLRVRVAAAPVDDAANRAMVRLLARELGVAPRSVRIVGGATARTKVVTVAGMHAGRLRAKWPGLVP
jgi:uncharacterized protein YggU (UPF0235/DUF167 family)